MREFLFKLDIIAPSATLLLSLTFVVIRKGFKAFSDYILVAFLAAQVVFNLAAAILQAASINNLLVYFANFIVIFTLFAFYFSKGLNRKKVLLGSIIFAVSALLVIFLGNPDHNFPSYL